VGIELHFNRFPGFGLSGLPSPLTDGVLGGLCQYRMPTPHLDRLDAAIGQNQRVNPNSSAQVHRARELRVLRYDAVNHFADGLGRFLLLLLGKRRIGSEDNCPKENQ